VSKGEAAAVSIEVCTVFEVLFVSHVFTELEELDVLDVLEGLDVLEVLVS
jgi:hypothetical protein